LNGFIDKIELLLPFKAEYVSVARLTTSGVAGRAGFDIETVEDIKIAVAEVCNKLIQTGSRFTNLYRIVFDIQDDKLKITFHCEDKSIKCIFNDKDEMFGASIIRAFMDDVELCPSGSYIISMSKSLGRII
jgi:serine/threonine-protein kinase RsbW